MHDLIILFKYLSSFILFAENADSCSIYCVDFLKHNEVLTGNSRGHMKVWDLRNDRDVPATTFMLSDQVKVNLYYFLFSSNV